jgi:AraC family transcriptional regulator
MRKGKVQLTCREKTSVEYLRRINIALEYIEQHIDEVLTLDGIANASHFSSYHFHRIFHAFVEETVNDYVFRKRMEKAVNRLLYKPEMSVTEVADAGSFSSCANFSKAFKLYFGISPTKMRSVESFKFGKKNSRIGKLFSKYGKEFNPEELYSQFVTQSRVFNPDKLEEILMDIKVEQHEEKNIAYLSAPNGYVLNSVYATWDKIVQWANNSGIDSGKNNRFAICHDNPAITPENKCRYDAAIVVNSNLEITAPYQKSRIPKGKYAVAYYKDDAAKINNFMTELCSHWFPQSGYEPDDFPPLFNYINDSKKDGYVEMNIYIKLKELIVF